jgi:hypothetical protein
MGLFTNRLRWLVTYAEHHFRLSRGERTQERNQEMVANLVGMLHPEGDLCPKGWWGLVLVDIGDFLESASLLFCPFTNAYLTAILCI